MKKQLQHTTVVVFILLLFLGGTLYILDSSYFKATNQLTGATIASSSDNENDPCTEYQKQTDKRDETNELDEFKERVEEDCPET